MKFLKILSRNEMKHIMAGGDGNCDLYCCDHDGNCTPDQFAQQIDAPCSSNEECQAAGAGYSCPAGYYVAGSC